MNLISRLWQQAPVTFAAATLCILVYLAMLYSGAHFADPHNQALIAWGGNFRPLTANGQGWRLLSALFVHGGIIHLFMNMVALLDIGYLLEQKIGRRMMLVVFLLSGLIGGLCSLTWHPLTVGVGASGAIMGLAGALLVWLLLPKLERAADIERRVQVRALALGLGLTLGVGLWLERIDNAAHIGGLVTGLILGGVIYVLDRLRPGAIKRWLASGVILFGGLLLVRTQLDAQLADEYRFRKSLPALAAIITQYGDVGAYLQRRMLLEENRPHPAMNTLSPEQVQQMLAQKSVQWVDNAYQQALRAWDNCQYQSQSWGRMQLDKDQARLASQIATYCELKERQYHLLRRHLHKPEAQNRDLARLLQQGQAIEHKMLPALFQEVETERYIQRQMGMNMHGGRRVREVISAPSAVPANPANPSNPATPSTPAPAPAASAAAS